MLLTLVAKMLLSLGLLGMMASTVYSVMVAAGVWRFVRARRLRRAGEFAGEFCPPVSLLKPLHGAEPNLEAHIESFFRQDYPAYEILFCARQSQDAGLQIAQRVAARYPGVAARFFTTGEPKYINAKVASLERMAEAASHSILIVSDSDVRVTADYLRRVVAPFAEPKVGLVTCLYRGVAAEGGLWSRLEAAGMSIEMTAGVLVAGIMEEMCFALGPTMAVRRQCVEEMGGFGVLGSYCADDFVLGNRVAASGRTVVLSDHVIDHIVLNSSFWASVKHQVRWMMSTRFSRPKGHFGSALTFSVPFGLLAGLGAVLLGFPALAGLLAGWSVLSRAALAALVAVAVVEEPKPLQVALLYPLRDLLGLCYWAASYLGDKIVWRGEVYRLAPGGMMLSTAAAPPAKSETEPALTA